MQSANKKLSTTRFSKHERKCTKEKSNEQKVWTVNERHEGAMRHEESEVSGRRRDATFATQRLQQGLVNNARLLVQAVRVANMLGEAGAKLVVDGATNCGASDDGSNSGAAVGAILNLVMR